MSLRDLKITSYQDSVSALPDYPSDAGITAAQLKAVFDGRTDKEIKQKFNALIDEIVAKFEGLDLNIADAVENHNQNEDAHEKIITPIQMRIAEIIGEIAKIYKEIDDAENLISGTDLILIGVTQELQMHEENRKNPHNVTAEQIGLGRVDNTPDSDKSVAYALNAELDLLGNVIHEHYATKKEVGDVDLSGYVKWEDFEERTTPIENNVADIIETIGDIETALDAILAIQNELIGG